MSLEYLEGYSNQGGSADVWILRDESGKIIAFTMQIFHKLFIVCQHISAADVVQYNQKPDRRNFPSADHRTEAGHHYRLLRTIAANTAK